ncbi:DUF397 domain-containing protein [Halostreptopolyspora alba]|uniref:DUF397 domain-containing protein n=1 Tax=Halostreptopolyspora alba TaxID=2487137 RepID=A0A3N0ECI9_9ACTN|nr:DUF397 domain-containing protein [Nocardiopsaceae bacterium YIM 96095]
MHNPRNWHKSSYSGDRSNCVEVADMPSSAVVRDSANPNHAHLQFTAHEWHAFLSTLRRDEL